MNTVPGLNTSGKKCSKCHLEKSLSEFYIRKKNKGLPMSHCKKCHNAITNAYRLADPKLHSQRTMDWRRRNPDKAKAAAERFLKNSPEKVREKGRRWLKKNRDAVLKKRSAYRAAHPERPAGYRAANKEKISESAKAYYKKNKAVIRKRIKAAKAKNPALYAAMHTAIRHRRRARLLAEEGHFTGKEWRAVKAKYGNKCLRCGGVEPWVKLTPDHVMPIALGGNNWPSCIQPLCISCNASKNDQFIEYRPDRLLPP